ncbi:MAG: cell division protein FtsA [Deltaproteobacteria bacterium]|nr:cell division protein FtsA [Deltaproteobacteria bacterium]
MQDKGTVQEKNKIIAGVDIGCSKIVLVIGEIVKDRGINIRFASDYPSRGIRFNGVYDVIVAADAIRSAISKAEKSANVSIEYLHCSVVDNSLQAINSFGIVFPEDEEVSSYDIEAAETIAKKVKLPGERELLAVLPQYYRLDGVSLLNEPIGAKGFRLEMYAHLLIGSAIARERTVQVLERTGLAITGINGKHLAASFATTTKAERKDGIIVIDIGEYVTGVALYKNSHILCSAVIQYGGDRITKDISKLLEITDAEAKKIKERHGCALGDLIDHDALIDDVRGISRGETKKVSQRYLAQIIEARLGEILILAYKETKSNNEPRDFAAGVVITGATAMLKGAAELVQERFGVSARVGIPQGVVGGEGLIADSLYATAVGLLLECEKNLLSTAGVDGEKGNKFIGKGIGVIKNWFFS